MRKKLQAQIDSLVNSAKHLKGSNPNSRKPNRSTTISTTGQFVRPTWLDNITRIASPENTCE